MSFMDRARHVLQRGTIAEKATVLKVLGGSGEVPEDVLELIIKHMDDRSVTRMSAPFKYGELRCLATEAYVWAQFQRGRRELVVMKDATNPMSLDKLSTLCDSKGIDKSSNDPVEWYISLREKGLLPVSDEIFDPLDYVIDPLE